MKNFGNLISTRRKELKMTQKELALKLNVSDKTISKWETGASYPEITFLATIAKVLDLNVNDLFGVEDMQEKKIDLEEHESYNYEVINKYKNKIFLIIGLIFAGIILFLTCIGISDGDIQILVFAIGMALYGLSLILFISNNVSFRGFYDRKFYTRVYDYVFLKYSSTTIILWVLPFLFFSLISSGSLNLFVIQGILGIISIIIVILSFVVIVKISKISNFRIKKDIINMVLIIATILITVPIATNLLQLHFLPIVYLLIYIIIFRLDYTNNK
jgi:transcriptional regulator with XRE-family HTH domain